MTTSANHALVAMGANLPVAGQSPLQNMLRAIPAFVDEGFEIVAVSTFYQTPCFPAGTGPDYVNAAVKLSCKKNSDAASILGALHRIEADFGRRRTQRWGKRTLDLDFLAWGGCILPDIATQTRWRTLPAADQVRTTPEELILPHPRMQDRAFVLVPLAEIAPDWQHPVTGLTVMEMLAALPAADRAQIVPVTPKVAPLARPAESSITSPLVIDRAKP